MPVGQPVLQRTLLRGHRMQRVSHALSLVALAVFFAACGACGPAPDHCTPAEQTSCSCPDGTQSVKQCKSDGTWGSCQCVGQ